MKHFFWFIFATAIARRIIYISIFWLHTQAEVIQGMWSAYLAEELASIQSLFISPSSFISAQSYESSFSVKKTYSKQLQRLCFYPNKTC